MNRLLKIELSLDLPYGNIPEIPADCGGNCMCCTCHVYVDEKWIDKVPKMDANSIEEEQLEYEKGYKPGASRLSCQISLTPELDGLILHLRPDELL